MSEDLLFFINKVNTERNRICQKSYTSLLHEEDEKVIELEEVEEENIPSKAQEENLPQLVKDLVAARRTVHAARNNKFTFRRRKNS